MVPLATDTLLLNEGTGEFNLVYSTGFVVKTSGGGVPLPALAGSTGTSACAGTESSSPQICCR